MDYFSKEGLSKIWSSVMAYLPTLIVAIVIVIIGFKIAKVVTRVVEKLLTKKKVDPTVSKFVANMVSWALKAFVVVSAITKLGVPTTSFVAIIGAAGLAVGLALQGSLANFAGGVLIMVFKPFKVGDLIEAQGEFGEVVEIQIFCTIISNPENKKVIIPNAALSNGNIRNYSALGKLRVDLVIGVHYDSDLKKVNQVVVETLKSIPEVLSDPEPMAFVLELADSSVNFAVRPWAKPEHYWDVYGAALERCKEAFDQAGIEIPYPHQVEIQKKG